MKGPTARILSTQYTHIDLEKERNDRFIKSTISFQFVGFKTPRGSTQINNVPKRFYFVMRIFTFCEVVTDYQTLELGEDKTQGGISMLQPMKMYFLKKQSAKYIDP